MWGQRPFGRAASPPSFVRLSEGSNVRPRGTASQKGNNTFLYASTPICFFLPHSFSCFVAALRRRDYCVNAI
jgi:hypothetical protein